jgi:hypothetical protein
MAGASTQHCGTESIDHENDRLRHRSERERVGCGGDGTEATWQNVGKAKPV